MYQIQFDKPVHVHFIGIGGISMSGLAEILLSRKFPVSGSDSHESALTDQLAAQGAVVHYPQMAENITDDIDVVVYTAAIHPDNPEFRAAQEKNLPMLTRAQLLGEIMRNYKEAINVSGTHGKTTTTSMITEILLEAHKDPTVSVGGMLKDIGGNIRVGGQETFVVEACEYTNSFLSFFPTIEVILNVEADHLDFFKDIDDIRHSFKLFAEKLPEDGLLVINKDIKHSEYFTQALKCRVVTFGHEKDADYTANFISYDKFAHPSYTLFYKGEELAQVELGVTGEHNIYNSLAAVAVARSLDIPMETILRGLKRFTGTDRRFQKKGSVNGFTIIDDYAHHPQEIAATIEAAKKYPHRKLWIVFQPHTYSRTAALLDDFAGALSQADEIVLADIYAAREKNTIGISSDDLRKHMLEQNTNVYYIPKFEDIEDFLLQHVEEGDVLITMGAGDIYKVGDDLLKQPGAIVEEA
ncbi:UDP-N-acetylmuramate--L-alanine ligase [Oribacterium sp. P9]|uniref:UDP-N-acetylmuramate--L-alanine ligase n=1 Tax=unclassified Oribacterium TaxID=2629782 RepID=UPI002A771355|nr:UDP-N-acetylmuramate--L-alanine ligase [Oribacterium sp.]MDD6520120.1 UDP-N-acetylmuramate--L-alanine ligase [Oribacterium sp.]MDY2854204.1 UDP-N-acetylmuramate--L-alanine ligase [Oliverpabstia sp.]MEE1377316.1 UDP-N-acetylmuramate--L-alanine ligase [Oribacterium sp.]